MSYLLKDSSGFPWIVFTGDALFAGDVGRIDLLGRDKAPEMASLLYESIFHKLLPLGDEVLVCPAHGAGSVCGESIADRLWTTLGIERKYNPKLKFEDKKEFMDNLLKSQPERPPYFRMMEKVNLEGRPILGRVPSVTPLSPTEFENLAKDAQVLDTRMELAFGSGHVQDSQFIWMDGLASFAGWYLSYDRPILLVNQSNDPNEAVRILIRLGYDNIAGYLSGNMLSWHMSGRQSSSIRTLTVQEFCALMDRGEKVWILDVRSEEELQKDGQISDAQHIHVTQVPSRYAEVPQDRKVYIFCGSGMRSMVAASYLKRKGYKDLAVILGGLAGWKSIRCPIIR
jgi:hydroxyacylglutathione hydrolase